MKLSRWQGFALVVLFATVVFHAFISICYLKNWCKVAAITVYPFWVWSAVGTTCALLATVFGKIRIGWGVVALWLISTWFFADDLRSLARGTNPPLPAHSKLSSNTIRIVTFNNKCAYQLPIGEISALQPDIVFLQEAPNQSSVRGLCAKLYGPQGSFVQIGPCAILALGKLGPAFSVPETRAVIAPLVRLDLSQLLVCSSHLGSATTRLNLWEKHTWSAHTRVRKNHTQQLQNVLNSMYRFREGPHLPQMILAGDFNAPPQDAIFRLIPNRMSDAATDFKGWPATFPADSPLIRIDRIFVPAQWKPLNAKTIHIPSSDHRLLVVDLFIP